MTGDEAIKILLEWRSISRRIDEIFILYALAD